MRKTHFSLTAAVVGVFAIGVFVFNSCSKDDESNINNMGRKEVPAQNATPKTGGGLGFIDPTGQFKLISNTALQNYYRETLELDANIQLGEYSIQQQGQGAQALYAIRMKSTDNRLKITTPVKRMSETNYAINAMGNTGTCTCETTACATTSGCESDTFIGCKCTPCEGDCKKTSSSMTRAFVTAFFMNQATLE